MQKRKEQGKEKAPRKSRGRWRVRERRDERGGAAAAVTGALEIPLRSVL